MVTLVLYWRKNRWIQVGHVDDLFIYPLKGGRGISVNNLDCQVLCARKGPYRDRGFMIGTGKVRHLILRGLYKGAELYLTPILTLLLMAFKNKGLIWRSETFHYLTLIVMCIFMAFKNQGFI